jgi:ComF family protein
MPLKGDQCTKRQAVMELSSQLKIALRQQIARVKIAYHKTLYQLGCCDLCGAHCQKYPLLCLTCFNDLTVFRAEYVQYDLLNWPAIEQALPHIHFDHLLSLAPYLWPFTQWMPQFKYQGRFELARLFALMLSQLWSTKLVYQTNKEKLAVICVPLHIKKWQHRGYNQAHLIANAFAKYQNYTYLSSAIIRTKITASQVGQSGAQRRKNLTHAFALNISESSLPEHVLLVDDVITTGSTASAIASLLKAAGVKTVTLLTVCLTLAEKPAK